MPKSYTITLYYNTGFNKGNIPAEASVLATAEQKSFDAVLLWQNTQLATVRIKAEFDEVKNADYAKIGEGSDASFFVVDEPHMLSGMTAELVLILDPLLTSGGLAALNVVSGWTNRAHVGKGKDGLFDNILPEPWAPTQRLVVRNKTVVHDKQSRDYAGEMTVVAATCCVPAGDKLKGEVVEASNSITGTTGSVTFPTLPGMYSHSFDEEGSDVFESIDGSYVAIQTGATTTSAVDIVSYNMPGVYLFMLSGNTDFNEEVASGIQGLRSLGIESAVLNMYSVPFDDVEWVDGTCYPYKDEPELFSRYLYTLIGKKKTYQTAFSYAYKTTRNKKAIALYNAFSVVSLASGASEDYPAEHLFAGGSSPDFRMYIDPSPTGTCYLQPTYFDGSETKPMEHAVASVPWVSAGMLYSTASGSALTMANVDRANEKIRFDRDVNNAGFEIGNMQAGVNFAVGMAKTALSTATGISAPTPAAAVSSVGGTALSVINDTINYELSKQSRELSNYAMNQHATYTMGENIFTANVSANLQAPQMAFPISVNNASYFGHAFYIQQATLSDNDVERFDSFLDRYGYAQDKKFEKSDLNNRTKFNYIKTTGAHVTTNTANNTMTDAISNMFDSGVRIWHVLPSADAFENNTPKEI